MRGRGAVEDFLPVKAACRLVRVPTRAAGVYRAIRDGTFHGPVENGLRGMLVRPVDVSEWAAANPPRGGRGRSSRAGASTGAGTVPAPVLTGASTGDQGRGTPPPSAGMAVNSPARATLDAMRVTLEADTIRAHLEERDEARLRREEDRERREALDARERDERLQVARRQADLQERIARHEYWRRRWINYAKARLPVRPNDPEWSAILQTVEIAIDELWTSPNESEPPKSEVEDVVRHLLHGAAVRIENARRENDLRREAQSAVATLMTAARPVLGIVSRARRQPTDLLHEAVQGFLSRTVEQRLPELAQLAAAEASAELNGILCAASDLLVEQLGGEIRRLVRKRRMSRALATQQLIALRR